MHPVVDPDYLDGGGCHPQGGVDLLFWLLFPKKDLKKEWTERGERSFLAFKLPMDPLDKMEDMLHKFQFQFLTSVLFLFNSFVSRFIFVTKY